MTFKKGDIICVEVSKRKHSELKHPAVIWENIVNEYADFLGIMLTHSEPSKSFDNILMAEQHFENCHEIKFSSTYFVNQIFIKFQGWGPFYKGGKLTLAGVEFIESNLTSTDHKTFDQYI